jgi:hypothetical protein
MPLRGLLSHIDMTISDPDRSIPFCRTFFEALGWRRFQTDAPDFYADPDGIKLEVVYEPLTNP